MVVVEEGWLYSGVAVTIAAKVVKDAFDYLDAPPELVTAKDTPLPYAANLEKLALPSVKDVVYAIKRVCYKD